MDKHIPLNRSVENLVLHASVYARSRPEHWRNCASHLCWSDCAGSLKATGQSPHRREASSMRCPPPVGTLFVYTDLVGAWFTAPAIHRRPLAPDRVWLQAMN